MQPYATSRNSGFRLPAVRARSPIRLGGMRRSTLIVVAVVGLAACSGGSADPPVATRDVTGVTDPVEVTAPEVTASTTPPEPLDYAIEWTRAR